MKAQLLFLLLFVANGWLSAQEPTQIKVFADKNESTITYAMKHLLHSWEGVSKEVSSVILTDEKRDVIYQAAVSVKISSFDSKNANRDSHAIEATEAIKFPTISFASTAIKQDGSNLEITGTLTFHGVSKTITINAVKKMVKNKAEITGNFDVNMKDYNVDPPSLMGVATDEIIKMSFKMVY